MKRKKLNEVQKYALLLMCQNATVDYYDLAKVGVRGMTASFLVAHGLAKEVQPRGAKEWAITPDGKTALDTGYFEPKPTALTVL